MASRKPKDDAPVAEEVPAESVAEEAADAEVVADPGPNPAPGLHQYHDVVIADLHSNGV